MKREDMGVRLSGGTAVARALVDNGVTHMFGIHGYINNVLEEACRLGVTNIHFRHEQSTGFAADAYLRSRREPLLVRCRRLTNSSYSF